MMTLWTGFKQQNCASDNKIGPNEEHPSIKNNNNKFACCIFGQGTSQDASTFLTFYQVDNEDQNITLLYPARDKTKLHSN